MAKQTKVYKHSYPSDLTDEQWALLEPLLCLDPDEPARTHPVRDIVDGIFYFNRSGCAWRYIPGDLPPWLRIQYYFYKWTKDGTWGRINSVLRRQVRVAAGKAPEPTAGSIDAQSVKTTEKKGLLVTRAMTLERKLKVVNDTYLLIRLASY
jgi:putative transposase